MEGILEYVKVRDEGELLNYLYRQTTIGAPLSYEECGAISWHLDAEPRYRQLWQPVLSRHGLVHPQFCGLSTGFNFSPTREHTVPPHIDVGPGRTYNLLIPVFGAARIGIFETKMEELEFRHGLTHWMMMRKGNSPRKIGSLYLNAPALLNTAWLHSVEPEDCPRAVWCTRWLNVDSELDYVKFKKRVEGVLGA